MENIDNEDFFFWHDSQGHKFTNVHKEKIRYALCWVVLDREPKLKAYTFRKDEGLLGLSSPMKKVQEQIDSFAPWDYPVLIQGETGTGKEVVAKAIHRLSKRAHKAFIKINCAAIPETLFENELFGHIKGAFSGSSDLKHGLFELAHEGTLFLDEIASMPSSSQTKLLRALEDKEVRRLGDEQSFTVDVRIIAATNEKLLKAVSEKRFREDLYYRLKELEIRLLPLRERLEEIPSLIQHFLNMEEHSSTLPSLTEEQLEKIKSYPWPGNIRELKSFVRRSLCLRDWDIASLEEDYQERYQIKFLPPECLNQAALAKYLGKHKSTISRMSRKRSKS